MRITARQAEDIEYKLDILADEPDLLETYGLTEAQGRELVDSVPLRGGEWTVPEWAVAAVTGELADLADVWRDIARSMSGGFALTAAEDAERRRESRAIERDARAIERVTR